MRVFGCKAYALIPPELRVGKLSPHSKVVIFVGYPLESKGYLVLDPASQKQTPYPVKHVYFTEDDNFPYPETQETPHSMAEQGIQLIPELQIVHPPSTTTPSISTESEPRDTTTHQVPTPLQVQASVHNMPSQTQKVQPMMSIGQDPDPVPRNAFQQELEAAVQAP